MKNYTEANKRSSDFFSDAIKNSENDIHKMVGYSEYSHIKRFEEMLKLGDLNGKSILDVGCGPAAFVNFLNEKNIYPDYYGIDINEDMVKVARELHPSLQNKISAHDI